MEENISIRQFSIQDRPRIRSISCETAFAQAAREEIFSDDEVLADALTLYFTDYEPQSCFVAQADNKAIGYISGAEDVMVMERVFSRRILSGLIFKAFRRGVFVNPKNLKFFARFLISMLKGELSAPHFSQEYPATLHINVDRNFHGRDIGSALIKRYEQYLREERVPGVHFGTLSVGAKVFFIKKGFSLLFQGKRSYLRHYIGRDVPFYILGKRL